MTHTDALIESLSRQAARVWEVTPSVALALLLLAAGWVVARFVRRGAVRLLRVLKVDEMAVRAGVDDFLVQGGVRYTTVSLMAGTLYWLILLAVFIALLDALGLRAAGSLFARLVQFVPNVVLAAGILVFGSLLSRVLGGLVTSYLANVGSLAAEPVGTLARYAMLTFVLFMAAEQVAVGSAVLVSAFQIAFAAICLAGALAFGLGGRDWAARVIERHTRK